MPPARCGSPGRRRVETLSPMSTARPSTTSTSERAQATEVSVMLNSVKISVVKVWKPRISKAPYSARMTRATSRHPPRMARRAWPRVMRKNVLRRPDAEAAGDLLLTRVGSAQAGRNGQVDERVDRERHHEHRSPEALHPGRQRRPAEADDEVRDGERDHDEHRPDAAGREGRSARRRRRQGSRSPHREW